MASRTEEKPEARLEAQEEGDAKREQDEESTHRRAVRGMEQLLVLTLAIVFALVGFLLHALWLVAVVLMAVLWGYIASDLGRARRSGGVIGDLVLTIAEEARDLTKDMSSGSDDQRSGGSDDQRGGTRKELYEAARKAGIEGRSTMTKDQLRRALGR